jgi:hypothetical protein
MADVATTRYKLRTQSLGSNTNTWGDTKLNQALDTIDRGSKGYEAIPMTGDTTLSWANYTTNNSGQVSVIKLTGSLSSAGALIVPSVEWQWDLIRNTTGATITVRTSAGTGVSIPNGYQAAVYCDATDCYASSPTRFFADIYAGGQIKNVTAGTSGSTDAVNVTQMDAAIAAASASGAANTVKVTSSDTTSGYLNTKLATSKAISNAVTNPAGNEVLTQTVEWGALQSGGTKTGAFTPASNSRYMVDTTAANITCNFGGMTTPSVGDIIEIVKFGTGAFQYDLSPLKMNGATTTLSTNAEGISKVVYTGSSRGFVEL